MELGAILHILLALAGAVLALVGGIFLPRHRQTLSAWWCIGILVIASAVAAMQLSAPPGLVFEDTFVVDAPSAIAAILIFLGTAAVMVLSIRTIKDDAREAEYYPLMLFSALGAVMLAGAGDLMELLLGVLLASVGSYPLVAYRRANPSAMEALLKFYLFGALTNTALIFGLVLLYGLSGTTILSDIGARLDPGNFPAVALAVTFVLLGLGFKAGFVPVHFWIPDVYEGTTPPVAAFLSIVPKIGALLAIVRFSAAIPADIAHVGNLAAILSAVAMTWGNIAMFRQTDLRRFLGYSTIAQTGYFLLAVVAMGGASGAVPALLFYLAAYLAANLTLFAVMTATGGIRIEAWRGLLRQRPLLAVAALVSLLSLVGIPPLAGFVGKFALFAATFEAGYLWLLVAALINTVVSLYPYLRVATAVIIAGEAAVLEHRDPLASAVALGAAIATLLLPLSAYFLPLSTASLQ